MIRALLIDDDREEYDLINNMLSKSQEEIFVLDWASSYQTGKAYMANNDHDIYLIDYNLGKDNGLDLINEAMRVGCNKPIIILTGQGNPYINKQAMAFGASDYLPKNELSPTFLTRTLCNAVQRKQIEAQISHLTSHDILTGLLNRSYFYEYITHTIIRSKQSQGHFAIVYINLDHFKAVNDSLGHVVGDSFLSVIATVIQHNLREADIISRLGGDTFGILVEDFEKEDSLVYLAQKIIDIFKNPFEIGEYKVRLTCSIGIVIYPGCGQDPDTLMKNAERAMYAVQERGRNSFQFFSATTHSKAMMQQQMLLELRKAIENDEFMIHYQPQININSGKIVGAEALIRWQREGYGLVEPIHFLKYASESELIIKIGELTFKKAVQQLKQWETALNLYHYPLKVSINVSGRQIKYGHFDQYIDQVLKEFNCDPGLIELELTEDVLIENIQENNTFIRRVKSFGINMAIDDFGTGFSSLSYLTQIPIETIKLDRIFIDSMEKNERDAILVEEVIRLAKRLKLTTIAEGVCTKEQVQLLRKMDCDIIQGFLCSKPLTSGEFELYFKQNRLEETSLLNDV